VLLHQELESLDVLGDDGVFTRENSGPVELRGDAVAELDVEFGGVLEVIPQFGIEEQCLGRNAADMEARAAELGGVIDECDFKTEFRAANGRCIAGWPAADDCCVVNDFCQGVLRSGAIEGKRSRPDAPKFSCYRASFILLVEAVPGRRARQRLAALPGRRQRLQASERPVRVETM